jgi:glutathione S-transferase
LKEHLVILDKNLEGKKYLIGDKLSLADIKIGS